MFPITRLSAKATTYARRMVNNVSKNKIQPGEMSQELLDFYLSASTCTPKYSKNIFKRAVNWVKTFVSFFKQISNNVKISIAEKKEEFAALSKKFTKKDKKACKKELFADTKEKLRDIKNELSSLIKKAKTSSKKPKAQTAQA